MRPVTLVEDFELEILSLAKFRDVLLEELRVLPGGEPMPGHAGLTQSEHPRRGFHSRRRYTPTGGNPVGRW